MQLAARTRKQGRRARWGARLACAGLTAAAAMGVAAGPALAAAVSPMFVSDNPDAVCPDGSAAVRLDPSQTPQTFTHSISGNGSGNVTVTFSSDQTTVGFSVDPNGSIAVGQATVKGGPDANRYVYDSAAGFSNGITSDSGLVSPNNPGGQVPTISHVDLCFVPC